MPATQARQKTDPAKMPQAPGTEAPRGKDLNLLVAAARRGDRGALERLLADARTRFFPLALRVLGDHDEAEDAMQDATVKIWRNLGRFEGRSSVTTWLHRLVVNAALDRRRRRPTASASLEERREQDGLEAGDTNETPEELYARAETTVVVHGALRRLSVAHGEAIRLCDLEGESYATIASKTRCPLGTVMSRLYHARRNLAQELTRSARGHEDLEALRAA